MTQSLPPPNIRFRPALLAWIAIVGVLAWIHFFQSMGGWWEVLTAQPAVWTNLGPGLGFALLHASPAHLLANAAALLVVGPLAFGLYPKAALRTLPLSWLTSFVVVWCLGQPGSHHLGASGLVYGLMALLTTMGLLRRDRPSLAAGLIVWFLFAGALWSMLPGLPGVSWEGHLGGGLGGLLGAVLWRRLDPSPFPAIQWDEDDEDEDGADENQDLKDWLPEQGTTSILPPP